MFRPRAVFLALLAVVFVAAAVQHYFKITKPSRLGTYTKTAFLRWREPVHKLVAGENVYAENPYPNPPIQALILYPLETLPGVVGSLLWFALKVGMAGACAVWAFRLAERAGPLPDAAKAVAVLLWLHPVLGDLSHGNVNLFIAFLVLGTLEAWRRGWATAAGLTLGLAIACKVTPALFLPYFVWKRAWGVVAATVVGLGLWLVVVPGAVLGQQHNLDLLETWFDKMVVPFVRDGKITSEHPNQSIPGTVVRLLTSEPSVIDYDETDRPVPAEFHNFIDIGPTASRWVIRGCQAMFVLAVVLWVPWRASEAVAAECALVALGMLLFSERTWKHHATTLILPYAVLVGAAFTGSPAVRATCGTLLVVATSLMFGQSLLPEEAQDLALTYGSHTAGWLLLTAGVCVVLHHARRTSPPSAPSVSHHEPPTPA